VSRTVSMNVGKILHSIIPHARKSYEYLLNPAEASFTEHNDYE